ncbi:exported hypothetical protein [Frigoribacterium sp. 9N]|nr:exported hypothetical protein [Frigoribacterium sp. 9N]
MRLRRVRRRPALLAGTAPRAVPARVDAGGARRRGARGHRARRRLREPDGRPGALRPGRVRRREALRHGGPRLLSQTGGRPAHPFEGHPLWDVPPTASPP